VQAIDELPGGGVRGKLPGEVAGVCVTGSAAGPGGFERREADGVGVHRPVRALGGQFIGTGPSQDIHHGAQALDRGWGHDRVPEVDVQRRRLSDQEVPEPIRGLDHPCLPVVSSCCRAPGGGEETVDYLVKEVVLIAYVAVERHRRDAEPGGKAPDGHLLITAGADNLDRGQDDVFA